MKKGDVVFIRTVTNYCVGRIIQIDEQFVILENASWIADTGRWHQALKDGVLNEVEPFVDPVEVAIGAIVDVTKWRHALPTQQK